MSETSSGAVAARQSSAEFERVVREEMIPLADLLEETFAAAAKRIEAEMAEAAKSGSLSFKSMVEEILADMARLAVEEYVRQPIENAVLRALSGGDANASQTGTALADLLSRGQRNS